MTDSGRIVAMHFLAGALFLSSFSVRSVFAQDQPGKSSHVVYKVGDGVTSPRGIYTPDPEYPDKPRKKKIQGNVVVGMIVSADGSVRDAKVLQGVEPSLDKEAIATVSKWRFEPSTKDGKPVAVRMAVDVSFKLY
jgi:periplasmic protein TonB